MQVDKFKLIHWLNVRKTTFEVLNQLLGNKINYKISRDNLDKIEDSYLLNLIAEKLNIPVEKILKEEDVPVYIHHSKETIDKTKREIVRDGIHFYNYYTLPSPHGYVAPVLIDILCPKKRLPKLNNGHLESAITLSLGPNDIYARFDKKINKNTFCKFKVNKDPKTSWVIGDNYFEPSYCLHTYSRATNGPGRILSYTTQSYLENFFGKKINDNTFDNFYKSSSKFKDLTRFFLKQSLDDKGFELDYISKRTKINLKELKKYFFSSKKNLKINQIKKICDIADLDFRLFAQRKHKEDIVGKNYYSYKHSLKTIRSFKSYKIASISSSTRFPDLFGYYIKVDSKKLKVTADLYDSCCSHYLVTNGNLTLNVKKNEKIEKIFLKEGDAVWISSFTYHGFAGTGSLAKISDGQNFNYLEKVDLMNLYNPKKTLKRARKDKVNWGYDE